MSLELRILTPHGAVEDVKATTITATGLHGEFGVLNGHLPFMTALKTGPLVFLPEGEKLERHFALGEGFAEVFGDTVTLFVETAEEAPEIDVERSKVALERADKEIDKLSGLAANHPDLVRAVSKRNRALTRLEVAKHSDNYKTY